ncbi:hypothetical protein BT96DRAFT_999944 [Gymnopus androsaceus JB14]|uniref:Uncharacterized protein n=1 Tax=Gymnopus androsaceus JB14 TaxID=1447944 RepID=A0A6A4H5A3_9AGAR|nr:hypothetical protein BT96DRAFT_999944 [Gymnopus androsaceus JB14]
MSSTNGAYHSGLYFDILALFFCGRFPSTISVFSMTATMQPGPPLLSVCSTLGFSSSRFHLIRRSNKCPNTKIILETLTSAIGGTEFPQLIPYLNQCRKTVIHARTIDLSYRIFMFLFNHTPTSSNPLRQYGCTTL